MTILDGLAIGLTPGQWRLVDQLAVTLGSTQAAWLSGYFAGLGRQAAGETAQLVPGSPRAARRLTILYGTATGNAAGLARELAEAAELQGLAPAVADMADYKMRQLGQEEDLLVIVSTYGDGDPPQPASGFFEHLEGRKAPQLDGVRFAVLALGDSTYEHYCEAGKRIDQQLEALGATRLAPRIDCDVDFDEPAARWRIDILAQLGAPQPVRPAEVAAAALPTTAGTAHDRRNPFLATVIDNLPIVGRGSSKDTRHVELSLAGSALHYEPGDALAIAASNDPMVVASLLDALGLSAETALEIKGTLTTIGEALTHRFEITAATPRFLDYWVLLSEAEALRQLQNEDRSGERAMFLRTHHIMDIIRRFPVSGITPQGLASALRPLQPRLYSIASSLAAVGDEAHLTVAPVRYTLHGSQREGVASGQLAGRSGTDTTLPVYVQSNAHFRLPADDTPIVMIGAGTGVAPYRGFMQEREARSASGRSWLFFGERNYRTDFLYQTEWQGWLKDGVLSRMDAAFSRDGAEKIYVQQRMHERAADLFAWLEDGAHIYVCGDAAHLAPDVHEALVTIVAAQARTGREAAEDYIRSLQADHRYQRDVY